MDKKHKIFKKIVLFFIKIFIILTVFLLLFLFVLYKYYKTKIPNIDTIISQNNKQNISIFYSNNVSKIKTYNNSNINNLVFTDLPSHLVNALVATEDRNFFKHKGVDYFGIARAFFINLKNRSVKQGGSTISQQLAKMILEDNSKTLKRKFKEFILTMELEKYLTKQDIMVLYLVKSYFGAGNYGIRNASKFYFNKEVEDLDLEESAMLIGLLKAPSKYSPTKNKELTEARTSQVILNMKNAGFLDEEDALDYIIPDLNLSYYKQNHNQDYYFTDWIYSQLENYDIDENLVNISITSTLNEEIQAKTKNIVSDFIKNNEKKIGKSELAVLVMNKNGEILSMIGGKDYSKSQFNRVLFANRQTGSLFKLFVYLAGFENGLKVDDTFIDEPIKVANWYPENNNSKYRGKISVKDAFAVSSNSVAVQIADYFGIKSVINIANKLGLINKFKNDLTIVLGSQENNLLEMTTAYATIANDGIPIFPYGIKYITSRGKIIYKRNISQKDPIFRADVVENMKYLLFSVVNEGTGKLAKVESLISETHIYNMLHNDKQYFIGGKTGSTQDTKDAWFIGFADDYIVGVWFGNDDNTPTNKIMGGNLPAMLWGDIVRSIVE